MRGAQAVVLTKAVTVDGLISGAGASAALLAASAALDALVRPRIPAGNRMRGAAGLWLLALMTAALLGLFLMLCGNVPVAAALTLAVQALLAVASNAKHAMLGEPLLFSDLALIGAIFRHPQFYLSAVAMWQRIVAAIVAAGLLAVLGWLFVADPAPHLAGAALLAGALTVLALSLRSGPYRLLARVPDAHGDTRRLGLYPTLLLYWLRWRESRDPPPCPEPARQPPQDAPEIVVVIQCESFADPVELFGDPAAALPGLAFARKNACQWGDLQVSGFGAYTMRTEYGVLFGREEEALGFRRYDPFLTALGEGSYALPARLKGWRSLFIHPHDMRFYGRDRIMPEGGFAELVGEDCFAPPGPGEGRYVTDAAMADEITALAQAAREPSLLYAVTIENHGPWASDGTPGGTDLMNGYLRLVRNSDAMLTTLTERLSALKRPALLVFFGDHRPSIPGATAPPAAEPAPGAAPGRHTPYVMVRMDAEGRIVPGEGRRADLTPAALHHAVLDMVLGAPL
ncbi:MULTISPECIES: LTA synthase family protein [unclassified Novosphingobium]|uniref:LTA synthase family protein n=1 Tax=unclassified Novosphingobium TaxID=2644732 RepID=UPI001F34D23B|nr:MULTISPECIES: LTA synthase family protein [unclassified Novosphingobium]